MTHDETYSTFIRDIARAALIGREVNKEECFTSSEIIQGLMVELAEAWRERDRLREALEGTQALVRDGTAREYRLATELGAARQERDMAHAERDTLLLDVGDFVSWFNRHYPDPSQHPDHPWSVINARLQAHDAALGEKE